MIAAKPTKRRSQKRQNQARRRPTMSSSRSSALSTPKRLGHGISLRKTRSAKPRKTITIPSEASRAFQQLQPFCCVNQTIERRRGHHRDERRDARQTAPGARQLQGGLA